MSVPDWTLEDGVKDPSTRVFRRVVQVEVFWFATDDADTGFRDWEGEMRDAVMSADPPGWAGESWTSEVQELAPKGSA